MGNGASGQSKKYAVAPQYPPQFPAQYSAPQQFPEGSAAAAAAGVLPPYAVNANGTAPWMAQNLAEYNKALAMQSASIYQACAMNGPLSRQEGGGGQAVSPQDYAAFRALQTGMLGEPGLAPMISEGGGGPRMEHMYPTSISTVSGANQPLGTGTEAQLAFLDPVGAAKLDRAMSLTAIPARFKATQAQEDAQQAAQMAAAMRMAGKIDVPVEELMAVRPAWVPTAAAMRRAANSGVDRTFQTAAVPTRLTYQDLFMGSRVQTPAVQVNADTVLNEPITAGQDAYVSSIACNICPRKTTEPM
jgi:hypothetical protein